jgi:hypothetical protein
LSESKVPAPGCLKKIFIGRSCLFFSQSLKCFSLFFLHVSKGNQQAESFLDEVIQAGLACLIHPIHKGLG